MHRDPTREFHPEPTAFHARPVQRDRVAVSAPGVDGSAAIPERWPAGGLRPWTRSGDFPRPWWSTRVARVTAAATPTRKSRETRALGEKNPRVIKCCTSSPSARAAPRTPALRRLVARCPLAPVAVAAPRNSPSVRVTRSGVYTSSVPRDSRAHPGKRNLVYRTDRKR